MSQPDTSTLAGKIAVMQAALEGKEIEYRDKRRTSQEWIARLRTSTEAAAFSPRWDLYDYRIKPQEPLRCWSYRGRGGLLSPNIFLACPTVAPSDADIVAFIEITPEVESALKAAGII